MATEEESLSALAESEAVRKVSRSRDDAVRARDEALAECEKLRGEVAVVRDAQAAAEQAEQCARKECVALQATIEEERAEAEVDCWWAHTAAH